MLTTPFLTDLDSRAAVKGSRDPLGIQQIWTRMGRHVVGNLTTVSNSVRDFTTLLLGYYFAERIADGQGPGTAQQGLRVPRHRPRQEKPLGEPPRHAVRGTRPPDTREPKNLRPLGPLHGACPILRACRWRSSAAHAACLRTRRTALSADSREKVSQRPATHLRRTRGPRHQA